MRRGPAVALMLLASATFGARAEDPRPSLWRLRLDANRSAVRFELDATLHTVRGRFRIRDGSIEFPASGGAVHGSIVIDAASGDTENARRDRKMHADVLRSATHPDFVFKAEELRGPIAPSGSFRVTVRGTLTLLGTPHPLEVPLEVERVEGRARVTGQFEVPYVAWGLEDPSTFVLRVAKTVRVTIELEGALEPGS